MSTVQYLSYFHIAAPAAPRSRLGAGGSRLSHSSCVKLLIVIIFHQQRSRMTYCRSRLQNSCENPCFQHSQSHPTPTKTDLRNACMLVHAKSSTDLLGSCPCNRRLCVAFGCPHLCTAPQKISRGPTSACCFSDSTLRG
jgi:hypothetical protein